MRFATSLCFLRHGVHLVRQTGFRRRHKSHCSGFFKGYRHGNLRGRLFLVHGASFRKAPRGNQSAGGLYRRNKTQSDCQEVGAGGTGYPEWIQVTYDPGKISYLQLLNAFWRSNDPTDGGGQFVDRGSQYQSVIVYHTLRQRTLAEATKKASLELAGVFGKKPIVSRILPASTFYEAEGYHQDYYLKNPDDYHKYRNR